MTTANISFHEATVTAFNATADAVQLELVDVKSGDASHAARIRIAGVTRILVDGESAGAVAMEREDGEVLTLDLSDREVYAIVQWNDFAGRASVTRAYRIEGETVTLTLS